MCTSRLEWRRARGGHRLHRRICLLAISGMRSSGRRRRTGEGEREGHVRCMCELSVHARCVSRLSHIPYQGAISYPSRISYPAFTQPRNLHSRTSGLSHYPSISPSRPPLLTVYSSHPANQPTSQRAPASTVARVSPPSPSLPPHLHHTTPHRTAPCQAPAGPLLP